MITEVRIGFVPYLNMAPFHRGFGPEPIIRGAYAFHFMPLSPRELGESAARGDIDAGALSLVDLLACNATFEPVGEFGIGVVKDAQSVLLFSRRPIETLSGATIAVTDETSTSARLLHVLLMQRFRQREIRYRRVQGAFDQAFEGVDAVLLIGDQALKAREAPPADFPHVLDLGKAWFDWQQTPFVFARWAVRKSLEDEAKQLLKDHLENALQTVEKRIDCVSERAAEEWAMPPETVRNYWNGFAYRLGDGHHRSIRSFVELLSRTSGVTPKEPRFDTIAEKVKSGVRVSGDEILFLFERADLMAVGELAQWVRLQKHPFPEITFVIDSNPNYTNVCVADCLFCAFYRRPGDREAYTLTVEQVMEKIAKAAGQGATTVLLQGGLNPELPMVYYCELIQETRKRFPQMTPHFFSASEILMMSEVSKQPVSGVLELLKDAGQVSLPGGGAEVLSEYVRRRISPKKNPNDGWMAVHHEAHRQGFKSTATMMYGHVDRPVDWVEHLTRVRELQDEFGGFTAFIPWSFKPGHTALERKIPAGAGPSMYLRMLAVSRLPLDNVPHVQASWFSEGKKVGQIALHFGADDFGGTLIDENVHKATGHINTTTLEYTLQMIHEAGFDAVQRTTLYDRVKVFPRRVVPTKIAV